MPRACELAVLAWAAVVCGVVLCRVFKVQIGLVKTGVVVMLFCAGLCAALAAVQAWRGYVDLGSLVGLGFLSAYLALSAREWWQGVPVWLQLYGRRS
jgi:hypothetical protein